jgi:prophage regulatory protein
MSTHQHRALWKRRQVEQQTGVSRSHLYALMQKGEFPRPVRLSARAVAWDSVAVLAWIDGRIAASQAA